MPAMNRNELAISASSDNNSQYTSDTESAAADYLVPDVAMMRRLRATLVEGRAAPEFQRLLIERQVQSKWNSPTFAPGSPAAAPVASARLPKGAASEFPLNATNAAIKGSREAVAAGLLDSPITSPNSRSSGGRTSRCAPALTLEGMEEAEEPGEFWPWLHNAVLQQIPLLSCLIGVREYCGEHTAPAHDRVGGSC